MCEIRPKRVFGYTFSKITGYFMKYYKFVGMTLYRDSVILNFSDDC